MTSPSLVDRLVQRALLLTSQVLGLVIAEGEYLSHSAVHEIRVTIKQLRAAWRLLETTAPESVADARTRLRTLHRLLAEDRKRTARRVTLGELLAKCRSDADRAAVHRMLEGLSDTPGVLLGRSTAERVGIAFRAESRAWRELPLNASDSGLEKALVRSYRRARRVGKRAEGRRSLAVHHRWRQRTKRLLFQMNLLFDTPPAELAPALQAMAKIAENLGTLQDCVDLRAFLHSHLHGKLHSNLHSNVHSKSVADGGIDQSNDSKRLLRLIGRRMRKRRDRAQMLGDLAFAATPAAFGAALMANATVASDDPAPFAPTSLETEFD